MNQQIELASIIIRRLVRDEGRRIEEITYCDLPTNSGITPESWDRAFMYESRDRMIWK